MCFFADDHDIDDHNQHDVDAGGEEPTGQVGPVTSMDGMGVASGHDGQR